MKTDFKLNDRIIWDSSFGYEIGYFIGDGKLMSTYEVMLVTGKVQGLVSHSISEIHKYSEDLIDALSKKYGYEKKFSETF
jgi:chemotaxis signal transduction protein